MTRSRQYLLVAALLAFITLLYSNHFQNSFHFDDSHTIQQNTYLRSLSSIPKFFTDQESWGTLPPNRAWRPLVFTSLAVDFALTGKTPGTFWFHATTFFWFLVQLALTFFVFRKVFDTIRPDPRNFWLALFGAALYGVHPVMAETVNYIIQRADLYSTLGVVAAMAVWLAFPDQRRYGFYLLPMVAGVLAKPPALMFVGILFCYIWLIEDVPFTESLKRSAPVIVAGVLLAGITVAMTPASYQTGGVAFNYRITQPAVILRYFRVFFAPYDLTADSDRIAFTTLADPDALLGFAFLGALIAAAFYCTRQRQLRPIAFGLFWFLLSLLPTSLPALAEVENEHRMFLPFVGLALAVCWAVALLVYDRPSLVRPAIAAGVVALAVLAFATRDRNRVWKTEESLWYDTTLKSPANGRGLMNYGLTQMEKGESKRALAYFEKALPFTPNYYVLEINLGIANGVLNRHDEAERHFKRAAELQPNEATPHFFYGRWLNQRGRLGEAITELNTVVRVNPSYVDAAHMLMDIYGRMSDADMVKKTATETLARFPGDAVAASWLKRGASLAPTPESYINKSLALYQQGKFLDSIAAAQEALKLRPTSAIAWNNIAAAYNSLGRWAEGIAAGEKAVQLSPDFQLAKNNLAWARRELAAARAK